METKNNNTQTNVGKTKDGAVSGCESGVTGCSDQRGCVCLMTPPTVMES